MRVRWQFPPTKHKSALNLIREAIHGHGYNYLYCSFRHRLDGITLQFSGWATKWNEEDVIEFMPKACSEILIYDMNPDYGRKGL